MKLCLIILCFFFLQLRAQKRIERDITPFMIKNIELNGNGIFKIKINSHKKAIIKISAIIEGESHEFVMIDTPIINQTLLISKLWDSLFIPPNDKLSAHKVISIELELFLPENLNLYTKSDWASVTIKGNYNQLIVELVHGNCVLETQAVYTKINTIEGHINVLTKNSKIQAVTKNGHLEIEKTIQGNHQMVLNTLHGNIIVKKQKI